MFWGHKKPTLYNCFILFSIVEIDKHYITFMLFPKILLCTGEYREGYTSCNPRSPANCGCNQQGKLSFSHFFFFLMLKLLYIDIFFFINLMKEIASILSSLSCCLFSFPILVLLYTLLISYLYNFSIQG